jgi:hypothetical protein
VQSDPSGFDALDCQNGEINCTPAPEDIVTVHGCDQQCQEDIQNGYQSMVAAITAWQASQEAASQQAQTANEQALQTAAQATPPQGNLATVVVTAPKPWPITIGLNKLGGFLVDILFHWRGIGPAPAP